MIIPEAELEVMKVLWNKGTATSFDIIDALKGVRNWNESTIRTLITRLQSKGIIEIVEKNGKTYTYAPILAEDEYINTIYEAVLERLFNGSISDLILNFAKQNQVSKEELEEIIALIEGEEK